MDTPCSETARVPSVALSLAAALRSRFDPADFRWRYEDGLGLLALDAVADRWRPEYRAYVDTALESLVDETGRIAGYRLEDYNLDCINPGKLLFDRAHRRDGGRYRKALELLRTQLRRQPRTPSGGFWHKAIYPDQMWLDGLYMAAPFLIRYGLEFGEPAAVAEAVRQLLLMESRARDADSGLLRHGWDEGRGEAWAEPETGRSPCCWGRAVGWYVMALVDCLALLPVEEEGRGALVRILQGLMAALRRVADPLTGLWWQVLDRPGKAGNYLEASASAMFVYAMAKGIRLGFLERESRESRRNMDRAWSSLVDRFYFIDTDGLPSLGGICEVGGLGGLPYRDGSFEYYISEPVVKNDLKGVGAFILAGIELGTMADPAGAKA